MKIKNIIGIIICVAVVVGIGLFIKQHDLSKQILTKSHDIWYCPMHPHYTSDRPGHCPICGMDLVKKIIAPTEQNSLEDHATISMTAPKQQLIGVRTDLVKKGTGRYGTIVIPREAVIDTGLRKIIFVQKDPGIFEPREIKTGIETEQGLEVKSGIKEGERIVISGNFLLDSESRIQAGLKEGDDHD